MDLLSTESFKNTKDKAYETLQEIDNFHQNETQKHIK